VARRIGIGGIWHETNTFARGLTSLADFTVWRGAELVEAHAGTGTEIGGALEACRRLGARATPLLAASSLPGPTVASEAREVLWDRLLSELRAALPLDGVVLVLHGAMVSEDDEDPESTLVRAVRAAVRGLPLAVTLDLHANPGAGVLEEPDLLLAYDTYPHVDSHERGEEAVALLLELIEGAPRPEVAWRRLPLLTCPLGQASRGAPMSDLLSLLRRWEKSPEIVSASLVPGYPYADVPRLGFTVVACGREPGAAEACADALAEAVWARRGEFARRLESPERAVERALAASGGPVVLADVADNVGGGSPGDGTALLRALLEAGAAGAVVVLWDPEGVAAAARAGETAEIELEVGGKSDGLHGPPLPVRGKVARIHEGRYRRTGTYMPGQAVDMGLCAVLVVDGVELVLTSRRVMPFDRDHLEVMGIDPLSRRVLVTKSAVAWQAALGDAAAECIYVDGPGICTCQLDRLPYERVRRPVFPLDRALS